MFGARNFLNIHSFSLHKVHTVSGSVINIRKLRHRKIKQFTQRCTPVGSKVEI